MHFYPRPPRGGRHHPHLVSKIRIKISIHALREEGDPSRALRASAGTVFLSTPSARRATSPAPSTRPRRDISIHALREEGDLYPSSHVASSSVFLSTPSARRATAGVLIRQAGQAYFYPRPPRGGRPARPLPQTSTAWISIHALREEGDLHEKPKASI